MKICTVEAESFRADRLTDMTTLSVCFRNFANAPKNGDKQDSFQSTYLNHYFHTVTPFDLNIQVE